MRKSPCTKLLFCVISHLELFYYGPQENLSGYPEIIVTRHNKVTVMTLQPFTNEHLNYFKFVSVVSTEFPKILRQAFKTRLDNTFGHLPGFLSWDDSAPCGICSSPQREDQLKSLLIFRIMPGIVLPCSKPPSSQTPFPCQTAEDITEHSATCS